ncbi:MAG: hypothetical protein WBD40_17065 [Tepidisphaeraceae bacterium]
MRARKLFKRTLLSIAVVLTLTAALSYWMFKGTPEFYRPAQLTPEQRATVSERADDKVAETISWVALLKADEDRRTHAQRAGSTHPVTRAASSYTVSFTQDELNVFFDKWSQLNGWSSRLEQYVKDSAIVLRKDRLILAGTLADVGAVGSFHFEPAIDEKGQLQLTLQRVLAGRLPMPELVWTAQRNRLLASVRARLPAWQRRANIAPTGAANNEAVAAGMGKLLLDVLHRRPGEPVIFLRTTDATVPVRLTDIRVAEGEVTLTVESMTSDERAALLDRIREPETAVTAAVR